MNNDRRYFLVSLAAFSACTGGGVQNGGGQAPVSRAGGASGDASAEALVYVNRFRASRGLKPLRVNSACAKIALEQSILMAETGVFEHRTGPGKKLAQRRLKYGLGSYTGENIAWGQKTAQIVVQKWIESPLHVRNVLDQKFNGFGQAWATHPNTKGHMYWTQVFTRA